MWMDDENYSDSCFWKFDSDGVFSKFNNVLNTLLELVLCVLQANTDILVGVKAELGVPTLQRPAEGRLEFFVDW